MKRLLPLLCVAMLLLALPGSANASASFPVTIVVLTDFSATEWPFAATGEAIDRGLLCSSGTVTDGRYIAAGHREGPKGAHWNFRIDKLFQCDDGSGSFTINLRAHLFLDPYSDVGTWNVLRGNGEYADLHGTGALVGTPVEGGVIDVYTGSIHID